MKGLENCWHAEDLSWLDELDAWEGYEFWSAQIETEMELRQMEGDTEEQPFQELVGQRERQSDGFPF